MSRVQKNLLPLERLEVQATLYAAKRLRNAPGVQTLAEAAELADQPVLGAGSLMALAAAQARGDRLGMEAALRLLLSLGATTALKRLVEAFVVRTRPEAVLAGAKYRRKLRKGKKRRKAEKAFPSGHTADAVAAAGALSRVYPESAALFRTAAALAAGVQIPAGRHYPSDVLAGVAIGLAGERLADAGIRRVLAPMAIGRANRSDGVHGL